MEKANDDVFWNGVRNKPISGTKHGTRDKKYDKTSDIEAYLTNTKLTTEPMDNEKKSSVFDNPKKHVFSLKQTILS